MTTQAKSACPQFQDGVQVATVESSLINEASGMAASRKNLDGLWTHNDSGDSARVYAMSATGEHLGVYSLSGLGAIDCEDMAIGPGPVDGVDYLYLGDIGDNGAYRPYIMIYRIPEPLVDADQSPVTVTLPGVETLKLQYPDGPRDAETLMIDPVTKDIYIVSKREAYPRVYWAPYPQHTTQVGMMDYIDQLPFVTATGGDISPDGSLIIVRNYWGTFIWQRTSELYLWESFEYPPCVAATLPEPQGEAICFDRQGCGYYTVSESLYQPIYYFARDGLCPEPSILGDLALFIYHWLDNDCQSENDWCDGADLNQLDGVNMIDFAIFAQYWP